VLLLLEIKVVFEFFLKTLTSSFCDAIAAKLKEIKERNKIKKSLIAANIAKKRLF
jgi:hypothetical protein